MIRSFMKSIKKRFTKKTSAEILEKADSHMKKAEESMLAAGEIINKAQLTLHERMNDLQDDLEDSRVQHLKATDKYLNSLDQLLDKAKALA